MREEGEHICSGQRIASGPATELSGYTVSSIYVPELVALERMAWGNALLTGDRAKEDGCITHNHLACPGDDRKKNPEQGSSNHSLAPATDHTV